jgi:hypothetical protein
LQEAGRCVAYFAFEEGSDARRRIDIDAHAAESNPLSLRKVNITILDASMARRENQRKAVVLKDGKYMCGKRNMHTQELM